MLSDRSFYWQLKDKFEGLGLYRPMKVGRYEAGTQLEYEMRGVEDDKCAKVKLSILKFVGGGFAGQVYQVKVIDVEGEVIKDVEIGDVYAMKILIPPSGMSLFFRNFLYWIGFGGSFQLQVNPTAARAGAIWQKFVRRAASKRFDDENCVNDIYAMFVDEKLGSCGEISGWVEGRTWRLEVDENMDSLRWWRRGGGVDKEKLGSVEYRAKYKFMTGFVGLLHEIGAHEFARQYEWTTCKSQPNALKRKDSEAHPEKGLIAVDFRAGLTLLPFLPMSPGDFKLIWQGIKRGSLVQFDRGNIKKLRDYVAAHRDEMGDMEGLLDELEKCEDVYRNSLPDVTHNGLRLLYSGKLWGQIFKSAVVGWGVRGLVDNDKKERLDKNKFKAFLFFLIGIIPILGRVIRKWWGRSDWRKHYVNLLSNFEYFKKAVKGKMVEKAIGWERAGRMSGEKAIKVIEQPGRFILHFILSILPMAWLHRMLTDANFTKRILYYIFAQPFVLYFNKSKREQWLRDMVVEGQKKHLLSDEDAETILNQLDEPYIQRYLISLVVHIMTAPITQIVSICLARLYWITHPEVPVAERTAAAVGIIALFQVIPLSPGSFCRGLYTTCLAIHDKNFKDYNIAIYLSYFKYIGYLAFPIQMNYRYPAIARFMAGHWATEAVHVVPVFGERGALFEHWIFCLFYNWPLTIRRRMRERFEKRKAIGSRYWHVVLVAVLGSGIFVGLNEWTFRSQGEVISFANKQLWCLVFAVPFLCGAMITRYAGGLVMWKRVVAGLFGGVLVGALCWGYLGWFGAKILIEGAADKMAFVVFFFGLFSVIGVLLTEVFMTEKRIN